MTGTECQGPASISGQIVNKKRKFLLRPEQQEPKLTYLVVSIKTGTASSISFHAGYSFVNLRLHLLDLAMMMLPGFVSLARKLRSQSGGALLNQTVLESKAGKNLFTWCMATREIVLPGQSVKSCRAAMHHCLVATY